MTYCTNCGRKLIDVAKFCSNCGVPTFVGTEENQKRTTFYEGVLHKCPNCGQIWGAFAISCSACGYELRGAKNSSAVRELALKLEKIESQRVIYNKGKNKKSKLGKIHPIDEQKISLIRSFAIPNTKEDIIEFMILAASNIDIKLYGFEYQPSSIQGMMAASQRAVSDAWRAKFEQAYEKAQLAFSNTEEIQVINNIYDKKMKALKKEKWKWPIIYISILIFCFSLIFLFGLLL